MSKRRIVLATDDGNVTIPLSGVFDVQHESAPGDLEEFFDDTVTIGYERAGEKHVSVVEGGADTVNKFATLVFKGLLNGTGVYTKHPARRAGRVTDAAFESGDLFLKPEAVHLRDANASIDLTTVTHFERLDRDVKGSTRQLLSVRHMDDGSPVTTELLLDSSRKMNLLGRFIRLKYTHLKGDLKDIELSKEEVEALVAIYSTGPSVNLATVLGVDASQITMYLNTLIEEGLVQDDEDGVQLTKLGRAAVSEHIEDVNV